MSVLAAMLTLMLLAAVMAVVARPLLVARTQEGTPSGAQAGKPDESDMSKRSELEVEREAKYREIRDAELDYRTGKLSAEDYATINGALRAEAVVILNKLESSEGDREPHAAEAEEDQTTDPAK
jgi:hypothetical protein